MRAMVQAVTGGIWVGNGANAFVEEVSSLMIPGVGQVMSHVSVRIDDGELVVAGEGLALGYLGEPPLAELRTGDLARIEAHRLVLAGRSKDMFIRGSTNVYPGLYEPVIAGLPGIAEAAIVGVPDDVGDDRVGHGDPPHDRLVGGELGGGEGLRHIVIRTCIKRCQFRFFVVPHGKHNDRNLAACTQLATHL